VYVIHWNAPEWCEMTVKSLEAAGGTVTVVHNGGRRPTVNCRIIDHPQNGGFTAGANVALRDFLAGSEPWVVIACHDVEVTPDAFDRMRATGADVIGPHLVHVSGLAKETDWLSGACLMISRTCVETVGMFDEWFGSYCEDIDYCHRAVAAGFTVLRADTTATTRGSVSPHVQRIIFTNQILVARKEGGWSSGVRRWATHFKEATYRAKIGERDRARDHLYAAVHGFRFLLPAPRRTQAPGFAGQGKRITTTGLSNRLKGRA
jgi:hypothetical protein